MYMKYNKETLIIYCKENNITLLYDYNDKPINRENIIEGICVNENCDKTFNKNFRQLVKTGAYCQLCMTNVSKNKIRDSNVKYDINMLTQFCKANNIILISDLSDKFVNRDTTIEGICKTNNCENKFVKPFRQLLKIGGYCQACSKENGKVKIKETTIHKYGVDNVMKNADIREKLKQSIINKYGVEHTSQLEEVKSLIKQKSIERYGVEYVLQSPEIRKKIKQTNLIKYGVENPQQNKAIKEKTMQTNLKKYGCKSSTGNILVKEKIINTNYERYGVSHHSQNSEIAEKMLGNSYNKKEYKLPSGKKRYIQGYENFMLDYLLFTEKIPENDIATKRIDVPEIWFDNGVTGKKSRHYVDFYIKSQHRCIEVKSTWTNQAKNCVFEKQKAAKDLGLRYEVWIFDGKGTILEKYI